MSENRVFELGLVLSGTVSAGPYTAGVIDYLIEALEAWYTQKAEEHKNGTKTVPTHEVRLRVIAANSGGAMTTCIIPGVLYGEFKHFKGELKDGELDEPKPKQNRLYSSWVKDIDITGLLSTSDSGDKQLASVLDCTTIDQITSKIIDVAQREQKRPYVCDFLDVYLTFTNIEGIPYKIGFEGGDHTMVNHADYQHFILSNADPTISMGANPNLLDDDPAWLDAKTVGTNQTRGWQEYRRAAVSSGSFPVVLKSQFFEARVKDGYHSRRWNVPLQNAEPGGICYELAKINPSWTGEPTTITFSAVDGGMANNDPLEYGRLGLTREPDGRSKRRPKEADQALIMVAPLNQSNTPKKEKKTAQRKTRATMMDVVLSIIPIFLEQSRFKYGELKLALSQEVRSRFLIAPSDTTDGEPKIQYKNAIYGSMLSAFGGFLLEDYRRHDYLLGRRNCQWFLQQHFVLPLANPIMTDGYKKVENPENYQNKHGEYQIIPRIKTIPSISPPKRVTNVETKIRNRVEAPLKKRINFILDHLPDSMKEAPKIIQIVAKIADNFLIQRFLADMICKAILEKIDEVVADSEEHLEV